MGLLYMPTDSYVPSLDRVGRRCSGAARAGAAAAIRPSSTPPQRYPLHRHPRHRHMSRRPRILPRRRKPRPRIVPTADLPWRKPRLGAVLSRAV